MKKVLKVIGIIFLILVLVIIVLAIKNGINSKKTFITEDDYYKLAEEIAKTYSLLLHYY